MNLTELLTAMMILSVMMSLTVKLPAIPCPRFEKGKELISCQLKAMEQGISCSVRVHTKDQGTLELRYNSKGRVNHPCTLYEEGKEYAVEMAGGRIVEK